MTVQDAFSNGNDVQDSDFGVSSSNPDNVEASVTAPLYGEQDLKIDLGMSPSLLIGDRIFEDSNGDGIQTPGEPGLLNVEIVLFCNGIRVATTRSSINGTYAFRSAPTNTACLVCVPSSDPTIQGLEPSRVSVSFFIIIILKKKHL